MNNPSDKKTIRKAMLSKRRSLDPQYVSTAESLVIPRIRAFIESISQDSCRPLNIMSYASYRNEFPTSAINKFILNNNNKLILPLTDDDFVIHAYDVDSIGKLKKSSLGIMEPDPSACRISDIGNIDLILMPGTAFDRCGARTGFGKGCYDRFIAEIASCSLKMPVIAGLCYDFQIVERIASESFDVPCSYLITQSEIISCC